MKKLLFTLSILLGLNTGTLTAELTQTQFNATLGIVTNFILDDGITFHGKSYKTVTSPYTGRVWLDRNIGANRVCSNLSDMQCYGDYHQWGRGIDGHQRINSITTNTQASSVSNVGDEFIIDPTDWTASDSSGSLRSANWSKTDGSSVCPVGFRVPTPTELYNETINQGVVDHTTAFSNFLKLPSAGYRDNTTGTMDSLGARGFYWTSFQGTFHFAYILYLGNSVAGVNNLENYSAGLSVRCIKNEDGTITHNGITYGMVTSPYTGKVWLDRNLGANSVCTGSNDSVCRGDYYQWGRGHDGHQSKYSSTTTTLATDVNNVGDSRFIRNTTSPFDWASTDSNKNSRVANWSATNGSSICPLGFRVPTIDELDAELTDSGSAEIQNSNDALASFLKLPSAGVRYGGDGSMSYIGSAGYYWTTSLYSSTLIYVKTFSNFGVFYQGTNPTDGATVRCIKGN